MRFAKTLTVSLATTAVLTLIAGCATAEPKDEPAEKAAEVEDSRGDITEALLTSEDIAFLTEEYGEFEEVQLERSSSESMTEGDPACGSFLDDDYGAETVDEAQTAYYTEYEPELGDGEPGELYVFTNVKEFAAADDAAAELDALRDIFAKCDRFTVEVDGFTETQRIVMDEATENLDVGDEGVTLARSRDVGLNLVGQYAHVFTRIDNFIAITGVYKGGPDILVDGPFMASVITPGVERVREYINAA